MPIPSGIPKSVFSTVDVTLTLATEVVVVTLNGISPSDAFQTVSLFGRAHVTTGAGATTVTPRIRRGSLTGALVGEANAITTPASTTVEIEIEADDQPGDVAGLAYVFTLTAAGVAGTAIDESLLAFLHS